MLCKLALTKAIALFGGQGLSSTLPEFDRRRIPHRPYDSPSIPSHDGCDAQAALNRNEAWNCFQASHARRNFDPQLQ
jgi:hypothetical protein